MKTDYSNTSMLDMVFEHRNKAYGAYVLRRDYNKSLAKAVSVTVLSAFLLIAGNFIASKIQGTTYYQPGPELVYDLKDIELPKDVVVKDPEPPKANEAKAKQTIENTEKNVVEENQAQADSIPDVDDLHKYESGVTTNTDVALNNMGVDGGKGDKETLDPTPPVVAAVSGPISVAEKMPKFPGGDEALMKFLQKHSSYPAVENDLGLEGKAIVKFVVNEDGSISNARVIKSDSPGFEKEALRVVAKLPKFEPGMQHGKAVKVYFVLPFVWKQDRNW
jgi:protein TonB